MDYTTEQRLRHLNKVATSADAIENRLQQLQIVVGRCDKGWHEAQLEIKALRHQLISRCCAEVQRLTPCVRQADDKAREGKKRRAEQREVSRVSLLSLAAAAGGAGGGGKTSTGVEKVSSICYRWRPPLTLSPPPLPPAYSAAHYIAHSHAALS